MNTNISKRTKFLVAHALFCAVAYLLTFVLRISGIGGFLTFDAKDTVIIIASMIYGPLSGVLIAFVVSLLEMITVSATGIWGAIMNFCSSSIFAVISSLIYNYLPKLKKKISGAVLGLAVGSVITVLVMVLMNLIITPIYTKLPVSMIISMIFPLLLPFNMIKTVLNASLVMLLYKSVSNVLKKSGLVESKGTSDIRFSKYTLLVFAISAAVAVVCAMILIISLNGTFKIWG